MAPVERVATVKATPATIWATCFQSMKWEIWDPDVEKVVDVTGECVDGTSFVFVMNDGSRIPMVLSDVIENKSLTAIGSYKGVIKPELIVLITPVDSCNSTINYTFVVNGCAGSVFSKLKKKHVVEGTEKGLANMVKLSEEAQK